MSYQVGVGEVAIVPTTRGFRRATESVVDQTAKSSSSVFRSVFSKAGVQAGQSTGRGFRTSFEQQSTGFSAKATRELEAAVAKSTRAVSAARLKEQDAAGRVRVAEAQLAEARNKYAAESSQMIRAQERLATASRQLATTQDTTKAATDELRAAQGRLAAAADEAGDELSQAGRRGGTRFLSGFRDVFSGSFLGSFFGNILGNVGFALGNSIRSGLGAGVDFLRDSTAAASDLNESLNAVNVSFGPASAVIQSLGTDAAQRIGLSSLEFNQFATQFSAFASTIRGSDVPGFIDELTTRGADFASVFNLEVAEALGLFQSGLAGETEPLRRYGIDLSAATVEAYAYANGIGQAGVELTEAQKQQARYGALLQQTAKTAGDFTNTSGELANQQRILAAEWQNAQARLGVSLLPSLTQLANVANDSLIPVLNDVIDQVGPQLGSSLAEVTPDLVELVRVAAQAAPEFFELGTEALPLLIRGGQILVPILQFMADNTGGWYAATNAVLGLLAGDTTVAEFAEVVTTAGGTFGWLARMVFDGASAVFSFQQTVALAGASIGIEIGNGVNTAVGFVQSLPQRAVDALGDVGGLLVGSGRALVQGFINGIWAARDAAGDAVSGVLGWVSGFFPHSPAKRGPFSGSGWTDVYEGGGALTEQFAAGMRDAKIDSPVSGAVNEAWSSPSAAGSRAPTAGVNVTQHFQHMDPEVAVVAAGQRLAAVARRAGA